MIKQSLRRALGEGGYRRLVDFYYAGRRRAHEVRLRLKSAWSIVGFLADRRMQASLPDRLRLLARFGTVSRNVSCPHYSYEILTFVSHMLRIGPRCDGVFVEAGCFKGGSTAKFSLAAKLVGRRLVVFDSFAGLPGNEENNGQTIFGERIAAFGEGAYCGGLDEVRANVAKYGALDVCDFVRGWFDDTLPAFRAAVAGAYIDVDLATSTRTCLRYLFPLVVPGGLVVSQDGHIPRVLEVLADDSFWRQTLGCGKPAMRGFGTSSVVTLTKA